MASKELYEGTQGHVVVALNWLLEQGLTRPQALSLLAEVVVIAAYHAKDSEALQKKLEGQAPS